jgi:uncharacterized protein (TIGR00369 family)
MPEENADRIDRELLKTLFERVIPFNRFLGIRVRGIGANSATLELPFRPEFLGNPVGKTLHGGVISSLLDNCGGLAVWSQIGSADLVSTVDLRVDYLRPGRPETLVAVAQVVRLGNRVGVTQLRAFHPGGEEEPVAAGTGVYSVRRASASIAHLWEHLRAVTSGAQS